MFVVPFRSGFEVLAFEELLSRVFDLLDRFAISQPRTGSVVIAAREDASNFNSQLSIMDHGARPIEVQLCDCRS